eukprot:2427706-Rhodomonas_salina.4
MRRNQADFEKNPMFRLEVSELQRVLTAKGGTQVFVKLVVSHTAYKSSVVRKAGTEETPEVPPPPHSVMWSRLDLQE